MKIAELMQKLVSTYSSEEIEGTIISIFLEQKNIDKSRLNNLLLETINNTNNEIKEIFERNVEDINLKKIENIFEFLIEKRDKKENGVVFTPEYIVNYIVSNALELNFLKNPKIIDPACGCGAFLVATAEYLTKNIGISTVEIVNKYIYGIDINPENVRRTKIILSLLVLISGGSLKKIIFNIKSADSLKSNWMELFHCDKFDYIVGNPPYVNTHDMGRDTISFLKNNFITTKSGTFNIFYAFVEKSMNYISEKGILGFIIPNNYFTITAAELFRKYLTTNNYILRIVDFGNNMVFSPVRTYSSLLFLSKVKKEQVLYSLLNKSENIEEELLHAEKLNLSPYDLDSKGWRMLQKKERNNIKIIESNKFKLKDYVKIGVATLKDNVYIIDGYDEDKRLFYKLIDDNKYFIESEVVRDIYKISNIKSEFELDYYKQHIIFPYTITKIGNLFSSTENIETKIIEEEVLSKKFPKCYAYLKICKSTLDERDKGKKNSSAWYAYGRGQGLSYKGKKLLFPTFSKKPKFILENNEYSLFCNGYAIIENGTIPLEILQRILNSKIMEYYISLTSYAIEGNYRCYQKKYIQNFSIPLFSNEELDFLKNEPSTNNIDEFLLEKYNISI